VGAVTLNLLLAPRSLPLWRPWLPRAEEGTGQRREQTDTVSFALPAGSPSPPVSHWQGWGPFLADTNPLAQTPPPRHGRTAAACPPAPGPPPSAPPASAGRAPPLRAFLRGLAGRWARVLSMGRGGLHRQKACRGAGRPPASLAGARGPHPGAEEGEKLASAQADPGGVPAASPRQRQSGSLPSLPAGVPPALLPPRREQRPGRSQRAVSPQAAAREAAGHGGPDKTLASFQHPVRCVPAAGAAAGPGGSGQAGVSARLSPRRLLWPRSKCFDYLYGAGQRLLESFPVQATLCLYEDSGSEEEEEDEDEEEEEEAAAGDVAAGPRPQAGSPGSPA